MLNDTIMTKSTDIKKEITEKNDSQLITLVQESKEALRSERFKDKFSRKAGLIRTEKKKIARALTELNARQRNKLDS